jgi:hypothetical protein
MKKYKKSQRGWLVAEIFYPGASRIPRNTRPSPTDERYDNRRKQNLWGKPFTPIIPKQFIANYSAVDPQNCWKNDKSWKGRIKMWKKINSVPHFSDLAYCHAMIRRWFSNTSTDTPRGLLPWSRGTCLGYLKGFISRTGKTASYERKKWVEHGRWFEILTPLQLHASRIECDDWIVNMHAETYVTSAALPIRHSRHVPRNPRAQGPPRPAPAK